MNKRLSPNLCCPICGKPFKGHSRTRDFRLPSRDELRGMEKMLEAGEKLQDGDLVPTSMECKAASLSGINAERDDCRGERMILTLGQAFRERADMMHLEDEMGNLAVED